MTDLDVREAMNAVAAEAPDPPADLLGRVEAGRRRHRRNRAATAAFATVVLLAAGTWAVLRPASDRHDTPAVSRHIENPRVPGFIVPPPAQEPPLITVTWPGALVGPAEPRDTPSGAEFVVLDRLDDNRLLISEDLRKLYAYDLKARTFQVLVADTRSWVRNAQPLVARSPRWIVWVAGSPYPDHDFYVFRAPVAGGERELVGVVPNAGPGGLNLYATDEYVYWTHPDEPGVTRMSMADGTFGPLPGFDGFRIDGTAWARGPAEFRNLATGEERRISPSPDTKSAECVPAFCLVRTADGWFVQRLDGRDRTALPWPGTFDLAGDLLLLPDNSLLDPLTGKRGIAEPGGGAGCPRQYGSIDGQVFYRWGCAARQVVYLTPAD
jgi:hypothetical protein